MVVNDDGGSIFSSLEQGAPAHAGSYERLFATPHGVDLAALCAATGTTYPGRVTGPSCAPPSRARRRGSWSWRPSCAATPVVTSTPPSAPSWTHRGPRGPNRAALPGAHNGAVHVALDAGRPRRHVVAVTAIARRLDLPAPILLVAVGVLASYLPFVPEVRLTAEIVLVGLLPPLLYNAALSTSLVDFNTNRRPILVLSVGLVVFTTSASGLLRARDRAGRRAGGRPSRSARSWRRRTRSPRRRSGAGSGCPGRW